MSKRPIPSVPVTDPAMQKFCQAVKEDLDIITGQRGGRIDPLPATATLAQVIEKINEISRVMQ
jgi:hypothetical protein